MLYLQRGQGYEFNPYEDFKYKKNGDNTVSLYFEMLHLGTVQTHHGLVFHIFEIVAICDKNIFTYGMRHPKYRIIAER